MKRLMIASGSLLALALAVGLQACSSSDSGTPTNNGGSGNATSGGSSNATGGTGGTSVSPGAGTGGVATGGSSTGGSSTGGSTAAGGSSAGGTGGAATGGAGGATAGAGGATGGTGGGGAVPLCASGETKSMPCTAATPEGMSCGKTCGIKTLGATKSETCTANAYVEGMCTYPAGADYHCYKLPAPLAACGATLPKSGDACTAADCSPPCGPYADSSGTQKTGYCVCLGGKYACASDKEWPPQ